jgi:hypothetical protein
MASGNWIYEKTGSGGGSSAASAPKEPCYVTSFVVARSGGKPPIGDGAPHPLSDYYSTLAQAQADYPHAQALTDTVAWCAIQAAIYHCSYVYLPIGSYVINRPLDVTNKEFGGLHFFGAGQQSQTPVSYTDLAIDATDGKKITSAAHPFLARNRWMVLNITGGTGFTAKQVMITSVDSAGVATCDRAVGTPGSTGGKATSTTGCGSRIMAQTKGVVFDCSGSGLLTFEDFYIDGATGTNNATIGFLFARTYEQPAPESSLINLTRVLVTLRAFYHDGVNVNQCLNGGQYLGSIGVLNWCSENMTILHCYFQADRAYIGENQMPLNICDDYPTTTDGGGITHGQPVRYFVPKSPYATVYGSDVATPVHITGATVAGSTVTFTTSEDLHDPALFHDLGGGSIGWYNNGATVIRGVTGLSLSVNATFAIITLIDSHHFSIQASGITGTYAGGGTALLATWFSEGMVTVISTSFIGQGGPCVTLGGVGKFLGHNLYTLSYHPSFNPNLFAAYQITGQSTSVYLTGSSEMCSRIVYSRYVVYDFYIDIDTPQEPDPGVARIWMDGQNPDPEGAIVVPGITAGYVRVNPLYGQPLHQLIDTNVNTGTVACRVVLASNQEIALANGLANVQVEASETWNPGLPSTLGIYDFGTHWGRREIGGPVAFRDPIFSKGSSPIRLNSTIVGLDTDVQISLVEATSPIRIHTLADHGLSEGQLVTMLGVIGTIPSTPITNLACHVVSASVIEIPGVSGSGTFFAGGILRASGKQGILGFFDAGYATWMLVRAAGGNFALLDARLNRVLANFNRDLAIRLAKAVSDLAVWPATYSRNSHTWLWSDRFCRSEGRPARFVIFVPHGALRARRCRSERANPRLDSSPFRLGPGPLASVAVLPGR